MAKIVVVNGNPTLLHMLEVILMNYKEVIVTDDADAYSVIKDIQPNLIILCVELENIGSFQVLNMLMQDPATRWIPRLTLTSVDDGKQNPGTSSVIPDEKDAVEDFFSQDTREIPMS